MADPGVLLEKIAYQFNDDSLLVEALSKFFRRALKGKSSIITISSEQKSIEIQTVAKSKRVNPLPSQDEVFGTIIDQSMLEPSSVMNEVNYDVHSEQLGSIFELDNTFPPKSSGNNKHIVDSQTGRPWNEIDELMNKI